MKAIYDHAWHWEYIISRTWNNLNLNLKTSELELEYAWIYLNLKLTTSWLVFTLVLSTALNLIWYDQRNRWPWLWTKLHGQGHPLRCLRPPMSKSDCFPFAYLTLHFLYNLDAMRWNIAWGDCRNMPGLVQSGGCIAKRYLWARDWQAPDRRVRWEVHHRMHHMTPRIHLHEHGIRCLTFCHNLIDRKLPHRLTSIDSMNWPMNRPLFDPTE